MKNRPFIGGAMNFLFFMLMPFLLWGYQYQLCLASVFQDEAPYLVEWIEYHRARGVECFRLYNNNSIDHYQRVLSPYIKTGLVQLINWNSVKEENDYAHFTGKVQIDAFNDAIRFFNGRTKWLALIDTDEFIVPISEENIVSLLEKDYWYVSGLSVNWQCFGTSGVNPGRREEGEDVFTLEYLIRKAETNHPINMHCKSIVQPHHVLICTNAHFCQYIPGHWGVNTRFERVDGPFSPVEVSRIQINHYWSRDHWFFENVKIPRRMQWGWSPEQTREHEAFMNEEIDTQIQRFLPIQRSL